MADASSGMLYGIGRRKTATAVVKIRQGSGRVVVNRRTLEEYFPLATNRKEALRPLEAVDLLNRFDIEVRAHGGGITGQVDAIKLGIARALVKYDPNLVSRLREFGLLTRDPRMKERKKYGQKGARKRFQWTKR